LTNGSEATGVVIERHDPATGRRDFIGPSSKENVIALAVIDRLRSEEDPERNAEQLPIQYAVRLLFAPE
jgi:hypothetical protein